MKTSTSDLDRDCRAGWVRTIRGWFLNHPQQGGLFGYGPSMTDGNFGFRMMNGFGGVFAILFWIVIIGWAYGWSAVSCHARTASRPPNQP
jgi:hypothetical protein